MVADLNIHLRHMEDKLEIDLICISNIITHEIDSPNGRKLNFLEVGRVYKGIYNNMKTEYGHMSHRILIDHGNLIDQRLNISAYLFMTLAEWREKQIDSILED